MNTISVKKIPIITLCIVLAYLSTVIAGQAPQSQRMIVTEKNGVYELAVAVSRLVMTIPKGQLVASQSGSGSGSPRYFSFEDRSAVLMVSGWFESEQAFKGMEAFWAGEQGSLTQNGIRIENVTMEKIGNWQVVFYSIQLPDVTSSNMRAELVQAGTWIDVHVSVSAVYPDANSRMKLRSVLESIHIEEKAP